MPSIRILLGPVLALIGSSAFAADLPNRKTPPDAPQVIADNAFNWNGAYIGGEVGLGIASDKGYANATSTGAFTGSANAKGVGGLGRSLVGGAFAGYNWQHTALVLGAEGDIEATTLRTRATSFNTVSFGPVSPGVASTSTAIPVQVSLRLRAGVAVDKALFYLTSGAIQIELHHTYPASNGLQFDLWSASWLDSGCGR